MTNFINLPAMHNQNGRYKCAAASHGGKIYVVGGHVLNGNCSGTQETAEVYDIASQEWAAIDSMSEKRGGAAAVSLGDNIVVIGGNDMENWTKSYSSVEEYDTKLQQWSSLPSMKKARMGCAAAVVNGKILVVGGYDGDNFLACGEEYNPRSKKWRKLPSMHQKRRECAAAVIENKLYVVGGYGDDCEPLSSAEAYDPSTKRWTLMKNSWTPIADMSTPRGCCAAVSIGGKIVVVGGDDGKNSLSSCESYDTTTDKWSTIASMNLKRDGCAAVEVDGTLFVIGGMDLKEFSTMESLDIQPSKQVQHGISNLSMESPSTDPPEKPAAVAISNTNRFQESNADLPHMHYGRFGCTATAHGGQIYVVGGETQGTAEKYDIASQKWVTIHTMITARRHAAAVTFGDDIVVMGGTCMAMGSLERLSSVEKFDTRSRQWSSLPPMTTGRSGCGAVVLDGKLVVVGGHNFDGRLSSGEEYDPTTQEWSEIPPMNIIYGECAAVVLEGLLYAVGGTNDEENPLSYAEVYNPATKEWTRIADMNTARKSCAALLVGGKVAVIGEEADGIGNVSCEAYDTNTRQWSRIASTQSGRQTFGAVEIGETVFVIGGMGFGGFLSSMESISLA